MPVSGVLSSRPKVRAPTKTPGKPLFGVGGNRAKCSKGTISEFELVTTRRRLEPGKRHKAQRGELFSFVPTGYIRVAPRAGREGSRRAGARRRPPRAREVRRARGDRRGVPLPGASPDPPGGSPQRRARPRPAGVAPAH